MIGIKTKKNLNKALGDFTDGKDKAGALNSQFTLSGKVDGSLGWIRSKILLRHCCGDRLTICLGLPRF